jgi:hypothetical protein
VSEQFTFSILPKVQSTSSENNIDRAFEKKY